MQSAVVSSGLAPDAVAAVQALIAQAERERGYRPVSDQFWLDLHQTSGHPALSARVHDAAGELVAYAQGSPVDASTGWAIESVSREDSPVAAWALGAVLDAAVAEVGKAGGTELSWLVQGPSASHRAIAATLGLAPERQLHQMRRSLPVDIAFEIETRDFDPERDVDRWVAVNARAFAWNPQQGSWTAASLRQRMQEPWFDPAGFLIHERDGRIAGFCWTKVDEPALGEIYVIAVDPDYHGFGLGRDLTLAGLAHLARRGIPTAMLFVDADNVAAVRVYDRLGFVIHRTDVIFRGRLR